MMLVQPACCCAKCSSPVRPATLGAGAPRNSSWGQVRRSMATHSRFRSPPEIPFRSGLPTMVPLQQAAAQRPASQQGLRKQLP